MIVADLIALRPQAFQSNNLDRRAGEIHPLPIPAMIGSFDSDDCSRSISPCTPLVTGGPISVAEAQHRLLALATLVPSERCPLNACAGRWSAAPVTARRAQPVCDLSAMDGYAIRVADLPGPLRVIGESAAGHPFAGHVAAGDAVRIFTGAAVPAGADTILVQEDASREGDVVRLVGEGPGAAGRHIRRRGLDFDEGVTLIDAGDRLTPARLALAAAGGAGMVSVNRRVRVALVATGDELVAPGSPTNGAQLPESNGIMLAAMLADLPVEIIDLGIVPDRLDALTSVFAAIDADVLVTTGGASVGDHDLVRPALAAAGGVIDFWRIALRPGKPMMAGRLGDTVMIGLPGNPVSAFVTAQLFVCPLIAAIGGARDPLPRPVQAVIGMTLPANDGRQDYLRGHIDNGRVFAAPVQDSSMLRTLANSTCLIVRPPHAPAAAVGDMAEILPLA